MYFMCSLYSGGCSFIASIEDSVSCLWENAGETEVELEDNEGHEEEL